MVKLTPACAVVIVNTMACPEGTATSAPSTPVHVSIPVPALYIGLLKLIILVLPYFNKAVIAGFAGILPLEIPTYTATEIVCAFIIRLSLKAGLWVKLVLVVPVEERTPVTKVVLILVETGSILSNPWAGVERYNGV